MMDEELRRRLDVVRAINDIFEAERSSYLADYLARGGRLHSEAACAATRKAGGPKVCVIHRPSLHRLTGARQILRASGLIEDECRHGQGHANPDSVEYMNWNTKQTSWGVHGCDGCCGPLPGRYDWMEGDFPT